MRNKFFEYYILSDEERIKQIWEESIIVLDTNVLLNLYRYSENSKDNLLDVLEFYKDRLWVPYQVGLEYHQDRVAVYTDMNAAYDQIIASLNNETEEFIKHLNLSKYKRHPKIDAAWFENQIKDETQRLCNHLIEMKKSCSNYSINDEINERVAALFDGKVGDDFDEEKLNNIYREGQKRYSEKIPPGYCDAKGKNNQGNRHLYGDLILWKQVIQNASEKKCNVILVTDDVKEDWYERVKGQTIGPRKELIREFHNETEMDILIYPSNRFLDYAKENMSVAVKEETISEVNDILKEDEVIDNIITSIPSENERLSKLFAENPWISSDSLFDSLRQSSSIPLDYISAITGNYADTLGKRQIEHLAGLTGSHAGTLGKNSLEHMAGLTGSYAGTLGKSSLEHMAGLTGSYADTLGKSSLEHLAGLTGTHADTLGKTPLEHLAGLTGSYADTLGKSSLEHLAGLTGSYADTPGKNPIEHLAGLTGSYASTLGKNSLEHMAGLTGSYAGTPGKNPIEHLAGLTGSYASTLGKNSLEHMAGLTGSYADTLGKSSLEHLAGLTGSYADTLGKSSLEHLAGLTGSYADTLGKNLLERLAGLTGAHADTLEKEPLVGKFQSSSSSIDDNKE